MINAPLLIFLSALYLGLLFYIAWRGDQKPVGQYSRFQPLLFTLSLAVYCSSWTFYGAVGTAAESGWNFFSIYLGPILVFVLAHRFLNKIISIAKKHRTTSIADFLATRHGNSRVLAALVSVLALIGTLPYIALQLKAVSATFDALSGRTLGAEAQGFLGDTAFYLSIALALFAIVFGVRRIDATEHHRGMIHAISLESVVKFGALLILGIFCIDLLAEMRPSAMSDAATLWGSEMFSYVRVDARFLTSTLLAAIAIVCLPRQFQMMAVESRGDELNVARWVFPTYLLLVSLLIVPITVAGMSLFSSAENGDLFVLNIPLLAEERLLAILVYIGGFSAATGMVIVATVALSTMVSNDLILPALLKMGAGQKKDYYPLLLATRRITILTVMLFAFVYYRLFGSFSALAGIGLLSFAAAAQAAPAMIGGLYWRRGHRAGAIAGLLAGFVLWFYTLMIPTFASAGWIDTGIVDYGPLGIDAMRPTALLGFSFGDVLTHGVFWSLLVNIACYAIFSRFARHSLTDRLQAASFVYDGQKRINYVTSTERRVSVSDIRELCDRFVGRERASRFFLEHEQHYGTLKLNAPADAVLLQDAERLLASSIGSAAAQTILRGTLQISESAPDDILGLLYQTTEAIQFNRELLQATLDHLSQGVSVVDRDLKLVAWNQPYIELFDYPEGFIQVGKPIAEVLQFNIRRGLIGDENVAREVARRTMHLRKGTPYTTERIWDNRVLRFQGNPMPNGGFVTSFTDITDLKDSQNQLIKINESLEQIVEERTQSLIEVNEELALAKAVAEDATRSKTRFLAAASHDLLQPLNAGKLFLGSLQEDLAENKDQSRLVSNALNSMQSAESLLRGLLDISKLDAGGLVPQLTHFPVRDLLESIETEFSVIARDKGLRLRVVHNKNVVCSDSALLRSVLQNFVSNAIRYSEKGSVMVVCKKRGGALQIQVRDCGPGIPDNEQQSIFQEFHRLDKKNKQGLGLGLAITKRIASLLNHRIQVRSAPGRGSVFSVLVPLGDSALTSKPEKATAVAKKAWLDGTKILCVDDEPTIVEASAQLLGRWGASVETADSFDAARRIAQTSERIDLVIADYQLGTTETGLDLLISVCNKRRPGILITAEQDDGLKRRTELLDFYFLRKPVEPAALRALITRVLRAVPENGV